MSGDRERAQEVVDMTPPGAKDPDLDSVRAALKLAAEAPSETRALEQALAADPARRADLRRTLRPRMAASPLTDGAQFTPGLEAAYRQMWRHWCAGEPATAIRIA
jgi:putative thioredoxin